MSNIITANFKIGRNCVVPSVYQYNMGMMLRLKNVTLPETYRVDFSNSLHGASKAMIGGADGVEIPYEYFVPGSHIYAWIVLSTGENDAITEYQIEIPIDPRAKPTDEKPTSSQQSAIDQAISALNSGVERAETAAENAEQAVANVQETVNTALQEAKDSGEFDGADGVSPTTTVIQTSTGATITVTDAQGTTTADISNGQDGEPGTPGANGVSPTVTVTDIEGGHRITITDANGPHSFDVMNGEDGKGLPAGGSEGQVLAKTSVTDYATEWVDKNPVVQVSGTTPVINALPGVRYVCGEVATLEIVLPESGIIDVTFESGTTATVLTVTPPTGQSVKWANGFDPDNLDADTTYEINIMDGLGVTVAWS